MGLTSSNRNNEQYKLAKYSITLGLLSGIFGLFTAIPSVVCGHVFLYLDKRKKNYKNETYKRMAVGGLIFGYTGILYSCIILILIVKIFM
jgi:hypothetical protein